MNKSVQNPMWGEAHRVRGTSEEDERGGRRPEQEEEDEEEEEEEGGGKCPIETLRISHPVRAGLGETSRGHRGAQGSHHHVIMVGPKR